MADLFIASSVDGRQSTCRQTRSELVSVENFRDERTLNAQHAFGKGGTTAVS
jgi:hypothetical protein